MQTVSSGWAGAVSAPYRKLNYSAMFSFSLAVTSGIKFFKIGTSLIGGSDIIAGAGTSPGFFDKYAFKDYSQYVLSINVRKNIGQYPYGVFMAQADVEMDNSSMLFLPGHDATIGSGILPNRPLKISMGFNNEFLNIFTGFAGQPDNSVRDRISTFHAFDAMNYIMGYKSTASGSKVGLYAHQIIASLLGEMGFGSSQYVLDNSLQRPIGYAATYGQKAGDIIQSLSEAEQALGFFDENGIFRWWNRQHFTTTSGTKAFTINYSHAADLQYENTPIINHVIVRANPRAVQSSQKLWELTTPITLLPGQQTLYIVSFSDDDGDLPVTGITIPTANATTTSSFAVNSASDGSGSDQSGSVHLVSAYSYGNQYWLTFSNTGTSAYYITSMIIYGTPAKVTNHIFQEYFDQASIDSFGRNPANNGEPLEIDNDLIQDSSTANSLARTLVYEYKDARKRYVVPVAVNSDPKYQIGDYGTLHIDDTGENKSVWIVGIENNIGRTKEYMQTLELEERSIQHYFTIGTSLIGGSDTIAP